MIRKWKMGPGEVFALSPVVPVMVIKDIDRAVPLARALVVGGIRVLEITLRTDVAVEAIREITRAVPEAVVGAGTVTSGEDLAAITEAGAVFAISPGLTPELLDAANQGCIALIPGIATVSELMTGLQRGYDHFKFFPAEAAGGIPMLKAIAGPFPKVTFCPTGGISVENYREYLALGNVACVGGSWVVPPEAVAQGDWELISQLARDAVLGAGR
ncbi:MAG: bifunctional 4-hydroxy-2-oxoglutarate aldolase/2-dehydro-3-deoxy-phosphogluconate aldolase [Desulfurivibrio sp.]|nr:bifunctional 4-hydroxy-2-oxoglutarate aldolase/2-dehydro-3-deoxy-phosphogluconate aldolase [Desulfurivibrio sp.]